MSKKPFNPLNSITIPLTSESTDRLESTSSLSNLDIGVCPKCKGQMVDGKLHNGDIVYYCEKDRVSVPKPNQTKE